MFVSILRWFCRKVDLISKVAGYTASALMPILAFIVTFEVFCRYFLNRPSIWAFDVSLFLFGYVAILGGAYAQQRKAHISVDILYKKVSRNTRCIFDIISFSVAIFFLVLMLYLSLDKLQDALQFHTRRQSEWAPPMHHFWIMTIIASGLFILQLGKDIVTNLYYLVTGNELTPKPITQQSHLKAEKENGN